MSKIIVIGSCGQIGTELVLALRTINGAQNVIAADLKEECPPILSNGPYLKMDILDREAVRKYIIDEQVEEVYLLAALLSATAEKNPDFAWRLNMEGLFTILVMDWISLSIIQYNPFIMKKIVSLIALVFLFNLK